MKELAGFSEDRAQNMGITAELVESNLYEWHVRFFGFDPQSSVCECVCLLKVLDSTISFKCAEEATFAKDVNKVGCDLALKAPMSSYSCMQTVRKEIELRVAFPSSYPAEPPFVRIVRPRFHFRTGHVG